MTYFYASGPDKAGNSLITSYTKRDQADKYRAGAKIVEGEKYLNVMEDGGPVLMDEGDLLVRTLLSRKDAQAPMEGKFVVWARVNGAWTETQFRYGTYAAANAAVKGALISMYDACAVIETNG